jgi:hypothetical protein
VDSPPIFEASFFKRLAAVRCAVRCVASIMIRSGLAPLRASSVEHAQTAPADEPIVDCLVRAIVARSIAPAQPVLDHKHNRAHNPPIVHPRDPMQQRKIPLNPTHLNLLTVKTNQPSRSLLAYESANPKFRKKFNGP